MRLPLFYRLQMTPAGIAVLNISVLIRIGPFALYLSICLLAILWVASQRVRLSHGPFLTTTHFSPDVLSSELFPLSVYCFLVDSLICLTTHMVASGKLNTTQVCNTEGSRRLTVWMAAPCTNKAEPASQAFYLYPASPPTVVMVLPQQLIVAKHFMLQPFQQHNIQ